MFGNFYFGSPLSYSLQAVDFSYKVLSNIKNGNMVSFENKFSQKEKKIPKFF